MRIFVTVVLALCLVFTLAGCRTQPVTGGDHMPRRVTDAWQQYAEQGAIVGIGTANFPGNLNMSRRVATNRARIGVGEELNFTGRGMANDFSEGLENSQDSLTYVELFNQTLSEFDVSGSRIVVEDRASDGTIWVVAILDSESVSRAINAADTVARLAVPRAQSLNAEARMNAAFERRDGPPAPITTGGN